MPVMRLSGKRLRVSGKTARSPFCCCGDPCSCPADLPTTFTVSGHIKIYDAMMVVVCDSDFAETVTNLGDPCVDEYDSAQFSICFPPCIIFCILAWNGVTCLWDLHFSTAIPAEDNGDTYRVGGSNVLGAYPDIVNPGSLEITGITVS